MDRIPHACDDGGILEQHTEQTSQYENYDGEILGGNGDGFLDVCGGDDDRIPYGKAFCNIQDGKALEVQNVNAGVQLMSGLNVQDDVGIQYANNYRRILNGYGYEFDPYGDVKPCGTLDYNGDVGGQTLCGVLVWLQNRNDNGGTGDDHGSDKIQSEHCCRNLDGNSDGALQTGVGFEGGYENNDHQDY